ncbi:MAG: hypothetical protein V4568_04400 [Pseudomonadota bacterium]
MKNEEAKFAKALIEALIGLLPGGSEAKHFASPFLEKVLSANSSNATTIESVILQKSKNMISSFQLLEKAEGSWTGWGNAIADDLLSIVSRANITPQLLIELQLDPDRLCTYLQEVGAPELNELSGRRARVVQGLRQIAEAALEIAPELSSVRLEFMRHVLKRLP